MPDYFTWCYKSGLLENYSLKWLHPEEKYSKTFEFYCMKMAPEGLVLFLILLNKVKLLETDHSDD